MITIIISLLLSLITSVFAQPTAPARPLPSSKDVVLVCESGKNEHILHAIDPQVAHDEFVTGIGAVVGTAINALYQDAAPVIMTSGVYENIYFHALIFSDCLKLSDDELYKKYGCYARFKQKSAISIFAQDCRYVYKLYTSFNRLAMVYSGKPIQLLKDTLLADPLFDKQNGSPAFKANNQDQIYDITQFLQAYLVHIQSHNYCYKDALYPSDPVYVCIPHAYAIKKNLPYLHEIDESHQLSQAWQNALGVSLKKLSKAQPIALSAMRKITEDLTYRQAFVDCVKQLLLAKNNIWSIFMIGHGIFDQTDYIDDLATQKKINYSTISGLSVKQFRQLVQYWNDNLSIRIFFYKSCSAGGLNFVNAFTDQISNKPLKLSYAVVTDTLCEAPTTAFIGILPIACFRNGSQYYAFNPSEYIDTQTSKMKLLGTCDYKSFFELLSKSPYDSTCWKKALGCVSGWIGDFDIVFDEVTGLFKKKFCADILSIRLPGKDLFTILDHKDRCQVVSPMHASIKEPCEALLLYQPTIQGITIGFQNKNIEFPACISMLPGAAEHTIGFIQAEKHMFTEVIKGFFSLEQLRSTKMITIKEVTCMNDMPITKGSLHRVATFTDVILLNNIASGGRQVNTIFFNFQGNQYHYSYDTMSRIPQDIRHVFKKIENVESYKQLISSYKQYFQAFAFIKPVHAMGAIGFDELPKM